METGYGEPLTVEQQAEFYKLERELSFVVGMLAGAGLCGTITLTIMFWSNISSFFGF